MANNCFFRSAVIMVRVASGAVIAIRISFFAICAFFTFRITVTFVAIVTVASAAINCFVTAACSVHTYAVVAVRSISIILGMRYGKDAD